MKQIWLSDKKLSKSVNLADRIDAFTVALCIISVTFLSGLKRMPARVLSHSGVFDSLRPRGPGSSVHGISQPNTLESVAISFSRAPSQPRD